MKGKIPRPQAMAIASEVLKALSLVHQRGEIAGSLRRGKDPVGDVELLLEPRPLIRQGVLFGKGRPGGAKPDEFTYRHLDAIDDLIAIGILRKAEPIQTVKGPRAAPYGQKHQRMIHVESEVQLDIFWNIPPSQWAYQLLLRTGPADFSKAYVTRLHRFGYQGKDGQIIHKQSKQPLNISDEKSCFKIVEWPYVYPDGRDGFLQRTGQT